MLIRSVGRSVGLSSVGRSVGRSVGTKVNGELSLMLELWVLNSMAHHFNINGRHQHYTKYVRTLKCLIFTTTTLSVSLQKHFDCRTIIFDEHLITI